MLQVMSISDVSDVSTGSETDVPQDTVTARRGGFLHGTKIATTSGWKLIERVRVGDLVRTLDHGFKEVRRVFTQCVRVPPGETRAEALPVFVPARVAYNGRPVWLMPEQGIAVALASLDRHSSGHAVMAARMLNGVGRLTSQAPGSSFEVSTLVFDQDEVIFIEGGLQAFCPSGQIGASARTGQTPYSVVNEEYATDLARKLAASGDVSAFANPLGALPAPVPQDPIFPIRPALGVRRPGRPGRPNAPALFLRPEWQR